ncbi:MAG: Rossmann-like and DUF2520 domain-containing protein, partial [Clostridium sp.]
KSNEVIFITVSDSAVKEVFEQISHLNIRDKIIINTSGSLSSKVLENSCGAYFYSLHPIFPFSQKETPVKELEKAVFSLEGEEEKLNLVKTLIESIGNKVILLKGEKEKYHLACSIASNLQLALIKIACDYLNEVGFSLEEGKEAIFPLIFQNLNNIKNKSFEDAITGPIVRGDLNTIYSHLGALNEEHMELYCTLSRELVKVSKSKNGEKKIYDEINGILGGEL